LVNIIVFQGTLKIGNIISNSYLLILLSLNLIFSSTNPLLGLQQLNPKILTLNNANPQPYNFGSKFASLNDNPLFLKKKFIPIMLCHRLYKSVVSVHLSLFINFVRSAATKPNNFPLKC